MAKRYSQQFKDDAVQYRKDHPELTLVDTANHLGISVSALKHWLIVGESRMMEPSISRGSGNYSSDEAKENARLKRQLRDAEDALEVLKKSHRYPGKMTVAVYTATRDYTDEVRRNNPKRRVSVSGILHSLGVSTSGYHAWKRHVPSDSETAQSPDKGVKFRIFINAPTRSTGRTENFSAIMRQQGNSDRRAHHRQIYA
jgi:transposase